MAGRTRMDAKELDGGLVDTSTGYYLVPDTWSVGGDLVYRDDLDHVCVRGQCGDYALASLKITGRSVQFTSFGTRRVRVRATLAAIEDQRPDELKGWLFF
jgi:hypothetical protein